MKENWKAMPLILKLIFVSNVISIVTTAMNWNGFIERSMNSHPFGIANSTLGVTFGIHGLLVMTCTVVAIYKRWDIGYKILMYIYGIAGVNLFGQIMSKYFESGGLIYLILAPASILLAYLMVKVTFKQKEYFSNKFTFGSSKR